MNDDLLLFATLRERVLGLGRSERSGNEDSDLSGYTPITSVPRREERLGCELAHERYEEREPCASHPLIAFAVAPVLRGRSKLPILFATLYMWL